MGAWRSVHVCFVLQTMLPKKEIDSKRKAVPKQKRLRHNVADLLLGNHVSALRASTLFQDAEDASAAHVSDLAAVGSKSKSGKNLSRDLRRKLLRDSLWPKPYMAALPIVGSESASTH